MNLKNKPRLIIALIIDLARIDWENEVFILDFGMGHS